MHCYLVPALVCLLSVLVAACAGSAQRPLGPLAWADPEEARALAQSHLQFPVGVRHVVDLPKVEGGIGGWGPIRASSLTPGCLPQGIFFSSNPPRISGTALKASPKRLCIYAVADGTGAVITTKLLVSAGGRWQDGGAAVAGNQTTGRDMGARSATGQGVRQCPVQVGDKVSLSDPQAVYEQIRSLNAIKSEYETTSEFEQRLAQAMRSPVANRTYLLRGTYDPSKMQYVADRGEFVIQTAAWDSMYVAWNTVHARYEGLERSGAWAGMGPLEDPWLVGTVGVFDSPLGVGLLYKPPKRLTHADRIAWMCNQFGIQCPGWAVPKSNRTEIAMIRNDTLHEALFMDAPLGFSVHGVSTNQSPNLLLEMRALVCRLLVALIGGNKAAYIQSPYVNDRQRRSLYL